ncbi:hypothetical protein TNCV_3550401 [Trichonephila clavipes]|nr:hypothetical protein TNCV_3550401 [Trichonephila clavipes]
MLRYMVTSTALRPDDDDTATDDVQRRIKRVADVRGSKLDEFQIQSTKISRKLYPENFRKEFAKVEQEAIDLSDILIKEEAGQAHRQQKRKITFGKNKEVVNFLNEGKISS